MSETHISAEQPSAVEEARVPSPDGDTSRAGDPEGPPTEGSEAAVGLIWRVRGRRSFGALAGQRPWRVLVGPIKVSFVDNNPTEPPRVAYAIGRKVGNAVERNRLRRRLRTIIRELAPQLRPGTYLIGVAPQAAQLRFGELRTTVIQALEAIRDKDAGRRSPVRAEPARR